MARSHKENPPLAATTTADFRNGMVIRYNGELCTVVEFHHVRPGNWRAFVRVRLKNLRSGRILEQRFRAGEEIDEVRVFFFSSRRRHTRLQGDWSSDVCSSD